MSSYEGFKSVKLNKPQRSTFDLSHEVRMSGRMGRLIPVFVSEAMPNDTFYGSTEVLIKLAPMLAPIMHRVNVYVHFFFIPNRLLWKDWETFITGGRLGSEVTTPPLTPRVGVREVLELNSKRLDKSSLFNYLGGRPIPDSEAGTWGINKYIDILPFAAYYKVWYDYYRDRNYEPDTTILPLTSGAKVATDISFLMALRSRCWEHDYFTSALPFTQRGAEVLVPMLGTGSITTAQTGDVRNVFGGGLASGSPLNASLGVLKANTTDVYLDVDGDVEITNSDISINDLRRAVRLQEWLERNALAGSRYNESIMAHFARKTSDSRLQRAEYLGGGKAPIRIGEVMTTAYSEDATAEIVPPSNPYGKGEAYTNTNRFSYNCEEHGFVIGILSVMPTSGYMQGMPRMFRSRRTFLDYPWPSFAHLGEQPVYNYEIYASNDSIGTDPADNALFGYQSRYAEWKQLPSRAAGDFAGNLDFWHLTRKFASQPLLNNNFVVFEDALQDRIFNVSGVDTLWMYCHNNIKVKRSLPYFGTPNL